MKLVLKLLILLIISTGLVAHAEEGRELIQKEYEISNVLVTFFWFDTEQSMQEYYLEHFAEEGEEIDGLMRGFSDVEPYVYKNICHMDLYAVRPVYIDDDPTLTIGHEVLHCVYGYEYHEWEE